MSTAIPTEAPIAAPQPPNSEMPKTAETAAAVKNETDLDLIMVVTNETMDDGSIAGEAPASSSNGGASNVAAPSSGAQQVVEEKREPKTPRASNCDDKEDVTKADEGMNESVKGGEKSGQETLSAPPAASEGTTAAGSEDNKNNKSNNAPPAPYQHPYYHHNNGYPQYPHHPNSQWNQWNHRHPQTSGYHPYYSRYPYHYNGQHPNGPPPPNGQHPNAPPPPNGQHPNAPPPPNGQHPNAPPHNSQRPANPAQNPPKDEKEKPTSTSDSSIPPSASWNSHQYPHPYPHWRQYPYNYNYYGWRNIHWTGSAASVSTAEATRQVGNKKRGREDESERELGRSYTDDTASTLSIGGSVASLEQSKESASKRKKGLVRNQNIHRDLNTDLSQDFPRLDATSTLSDGKMILQNLSITSIGSLRQSYSAEIAELCGPSPIHVDKKLKSRKEERFDEGKTPKKRNTSSKKARDASVFRLDNAPSTTPAAMRLASQDDDSPNMLDLIGTDTPLLLSSVENVILDDSITKQLRGTAFTPLPHILGGDDVWSFNGSPLGSSFEKLTPRFGLDSTKSKKNPLASPKSFWKDDFLEDHQDKKKSSKKDRSRHEGVQSILSMLSPAMRAMDPVDPMDGGPTSPIPIHRKIKEEAPKSSMNPCITTPLRRPPPQVTSASHHHSRPHHASPWRADQRGPPPGIMHSPIPSHHSHHHPPHMSPYDGRYGEHRRDAPPYGMYPPPHHGHGHYNPDDRIRNLRGRCPPVHHHMPPSHHLPPPSYHHFSPLTNVAPRSRSWHENQHNQMDSNGSSKRKCVPLRPPVPSKFQGDIAKFKDAQIPEFNNLVNFPAHMNQKQAPNVPDGMRCCVMCGNTCPCSQGGKQKKGDKSNLVSLGSSKNIPNTTGSGFAIIPTQNKGLCTLCDVNVWIVTQTGLEIKWCKGCKNFRPWAAFGDKGLATKCVRCRDRQREKYALQKEEKERQRSMSKNNAVPSALPPMNAMPH